LRRPCRYFRCADDGIRAAGQAHLLAGRVKLYTRFGLDWIARFRPITADMAALLAGNMIIDGELISADVRDRPNFGALQDDIKSGRHDGMRNAYRSDWLMKSANALSCTNSAAGAAL
jgi:ATP-dependent DNA ligase